MGSDHVEKATLVKRHTDTIQGFDMPIFKLSKKRNKPRLPSSVKEKVIITGPGRSGTTFLVQLLTYLNYDTGFDKETCLEINNISKAGLEKGIYTLPHTESPLIPNYIIKNPLISDTLLVACEKNHLDVSQIYIPIRSLNDVAKSRARVTQVKTGTPGGLVDVNDIAAQMNASAKSLYDLLHTATVYEIPISFILFPKLVQNPEYLYKKLSYLMEDIEYKYFLKAFEKIAQPSLVHTFDNDK
jgi:hypothetical protein